jgi:HAE1 family hydrophobic/amphiphilic exporter-1
MTLLALSLVIGILVDDSIVVLENIQRHMEMRKEKRKGCIGWKKRNCFTALSITLVDVVVFLPDHNGTWIDRRYSRQFSLVVVTSTLMSLFVCFTLTPLLVSRFGKLTHPSRKNLGDALFYG